MIRLLKRFADWLDRRFPPKVVVTETLFAEVCQESIGHDKRLVALNSSVAYQAERLVKLEASVAAIKDLLAKSGSVLLRNEAEKLRDNFIKGEFGRMPTRSEVEANAA